MTRKNRIGATLFVIGFSVCGSMAWSQPGSGQPASTKAIAALPPGYLARNELPDSLALLPPPPTAESAAMQRDEEARRAVEGLRGSARWQLAASDADLGFPHAPAAFACAAGLPIGKDTTPRLYALMGKMAIDVALSTYAAKTRYNRTRPFVAHSAATCLPKDEALLRTDGSYPSGHSALGWGWALVLTELVPGKTDAILARGRDFGQSRLVCDAHWQSDIDAGRVIASAAVARLHASEAFERDVAAARAEIAGISARPDATACSLETKALETAS